MGSWRDDTGVPAKRTLELQRGGGRATTNGLAERLGVTAPTATAMAKKLDEPAPAPAEPPEPVVKVRCRGCSALNDEHAKFCNQCGAAV